MQLLIHVHVLLRYCMKCLICTYKNQTKDWEKLKSATMKNVIKKFKLILKVQKKMELILYQ